jgi:hypothetical protein
MLKEATMSLCARLLLLVFTASMALPAGATDQGQYNNVPDSIRSWFKSVQSPKGVPCCDIADGHRTTWRGGKDGGYEVPIEGEWHSVPSEAIVYNAGNPVGDAVVWYTKYSGKTFIRCFVPGGGV